MGVTIMVGLMVWVAGSYLEFKIITAVPALRRVFSGLTGIAISIAIGAGVGFVLGAPTGAGIMLGQLLGLATNQLTFNFYTRLAAVNARKNEVTQKVGDFKAAHPTVFNEAVEGIKSGFKVIVGIVLAIVWVFGLPVRIVRWIQSANAKVRSFATSG